MPTIFYRKNRIHPDTGEVETVISWYQMPEPRSYELARINREERWAEQDIECKLKLGLTSFVTAVISLFCFL